MLTTLLIVYYVLKDIAAREGLQARALARDADLVAQFLPTDRFIITFYAFENKVS